MALIESERAQDFQTDDPSSDDPSNNGADHDGGPDKDDAMAWKEVEPLVAGDKLDVYADWLLGAGYTDFSLRDARQRIPVLLRYRSGTLDLDAVRKAFGGEDVKLLERLLGEGLQSEPSNDGRRKIYRTRFLPEPDLRRFVGILEQPGFREIFDDLERVTFGPPLDERSLPEKVPVELPRPVPSPNCKPPRGTVVVGIIDDGLPFAHHRFRGRNGTRVEAVWVQDGEHAGTTYPPYGRELVASDIDALLGMPVDAGSVDEDELYRLAGVADFGGPGRKSLARRASHGAHVMDLAGGFEPEDAPDWPLVGVQLPIATTADSSGATLAPYVIGGIEYIVRKAAEIAAARKAECLPIVINLSYGVVAGPHDGTHKIEAAIDDIVSDHNAAFPHAPLRVVIAAGNSHLARAHAVVAFRGAGDRAVLHWKVVPDDRTPSFVEIWLPVGPSAPGRVKVRITTPDGVVSGPLGETPTTALQWIEDGKVLCQASYHRVAPPTDRGMFLIALQPTARVEGDDDSDPPGPIAPSGVWRIELENVGLTADDCVEAWIQRDDAPPGFPRRGRQSYFDHECYRRFDEAGREIEEDQPGCVVRRAGSMNALATGREPVVIGGLLRRELRAAKYSAGGPVTEPAGAAAPHRLGPDALTVSDDSTVHAGVLAAGTRSGSVVAMNGTSVAAPRIARWIAGELAAGRPGDRAAVESLAAAQEAGLRPPHKPSRSAAGRAASGCARRAARTVRRVRALSPARPAAGELRREAPAERLPLEQVIAALDQA
jgi:hypothetical protein